MAKIRFLSFLGIVGFVSFGHAQTACLVSDIDVQEDFDVAKFSFGKWYEITWKKFYFEPPFDNYLDYVEKYDVINDTHVSVLSSGRPTAQSPTCNNITFEYEVTSDPAKWKRDVNILNVDYVVHYWIIRTDYDNYAFVYGCTLQNVDGTCNQTHAWKWSRRQILEENYIKILDDTATSLCMDNSDFEESRQSKDCLSDDGLVGGVSAIMTTKLLFLTALCFIIMMSN